MKANYKFSNICGTVYRQGNVIFTPDGNSLLSPVGNRVSVFDLVNNKSFTFAFENRKNIAAIALSPDSNILISVDEDGRALLVNFKRGVVLHHFNFHKPVKDIRFSPDGKYIAVTHGAHIQVWKTPNHLAREFAPFILHRTYTGHHDDVLSIQWASDSKCFISTSRDMTARLFTLHPVEGFRPKTFAGHRSAVLNAYFSTDGATIYTVSKDGAVFTWKAKESSESESDSDDDEPPIATTSEGNSNNIINTRWGIHKRNYFNRAGTNVVCTTFHAPSNLLVVGFSTGIFGLWEMPAFSNVHTLSISQEKISSVAINQSGEWLAFGAKKLGQLLVWEWQSESYILKQQGHYFDMNTLAYAPDGQTIATGGDDGKVKVWSTHSAFCFVTFTEHTAPISAVTFAKQGSVLFTASLDGTVRAFDLMRYRNFRTFTSPSPVQFSSLAVDPSGEVIAAGSADSFEIFMWSVQTGKLLDILSGHEGPVSGLAFSPSGANQLASGSWDRTVRLWNVFNRSRIVEPFSLNSDVLAIAFRPDGKEVAASTLDGQIMFFDIQASKQTNVIEGRRDISGGRKADDRMSAANSTSGKAFNSLAYTADGRCLLAGGNSKYVVLYDVREGEGVMVKKFQISENLSLDGTQEFLDSRRVNEAGINIDLIDTRGDESDLEDRLDTSLPGASRGAGDMSRRKYRQEARTKCIRFSPTGRAWAAASTEGLLIFSLDETVTFDPFDLTIDLTPESVLEVLSDGEYLKALVMAFRLNEKPLIRHVYESIPRGDIRLVSRQLPVLYVPQLLRFVADHLERSPHLEFDLLWANTLLMTHGRYLRNRSADYASVFRVLQKGLGDCEQTISKLCDENISTLSYIIDQGKLKRQMDIDTVV
ncbi:small nucleolar ribonucleoprotein complex subunit [Moniliophthora roreri]|uniref:Small-subunit processome Utp12 domain-containing protein n=1 Tax=Moniliophthora roreri TaxID=221103 RepID=A0A0W0FXS4_MONRR|nr:small nucleolar ribonucleoprotein complex subunit [Moniliophthora roreri]